MWRSSALVAAVLAVVQVAGLATSLTGTWTSKSKKVFTGPGFYNPVNETLIEPDLAGISYSFTDDGYFEMAYYRLTGNPKKPQCPSGVLQWQHGTYETADNGSLLMTPIAVDGRQLLSMPCDYTYAQYTRWSTFVMMKEYFIEVDKYRSEYMLQLYEGDGTPLQPLYLAYRPPQMLPTITLNPTSTASSNKHKRGLNSATQWSMLDAYVDKVDPNQVWWVGVFLTALGGAGYWYLRD